MGRYKDLLLNIALFLANSVVTKLISFVLVPLYTAYMSAGEYGLTDMSSTVISLIMPIVTFNTADAAVRYIVGDRVNAERYAAVSFALTAASIPIIALFTPLLDLSVFGGLGAYKGWFVAIYATTSFSTLCGGVARGCGEIRIIPVCAAVSSLTTLACAVVLIAGAGMGVVGYFASVTAGLALSVAVYLSAGGLARMVVRGLLELLRGGVKQVRRTVVPMVRYALPLIPNSLFWWAGNSINRFFITGMMGISASGMFAAASKIPSLLNTVYSIFQQAWQLSVFRESGAATISSFYSTVFRVVSAALTVVCALLSLISPLLASILLKGETYSAWPMIPLLLLANLMNVFNSFYGTVYTSTMHTDYIMRTTVFGALSCAVLTPLLIPVAGTYGACVASVVGQGLVFALRARNSRRYIAFDAGWRTLALTLALLTLQAVISAAQAPWWQVVSLACTAIIFAVQGRRLLPLFSALKARLVSRIRRRK